MEDIGFTIISYYGKKKRKVIRGKKCRVPKQATHAHVYAGKLSFGIARNNNHGEEVIKTKRGTFFAKPYGAIYITFNDFAESNSGYEYGFHEWAWF